MVFHHQSTPYHFHLVGIGGAGMSGIALVLSSLGHHVSGSDIQENANMIQLREKNILVHIGHQEKNLLSSTTALVYSNAIDFLNPEIKKAQMLHIPILPRAEILNFIASSKRSITIAGTHGKTTTTSILAFLFHSLQLSPTFIIGSTPYFSETSAVLGTGKFSIIEACEAFQSLDFIQSEIAILNNIDFDHLDNFKNIESIQQSFLKYLNQVHFYGFALVNGDQPLIQEILPHMRKKYYSFGFNQNNDYHISNVKMDQFTNQFDLHTKTEYLGEFKISLPGSHNILNAVSSIIIAHQLNFELKQVKLILEQFKGLARRFEILGKKQDILFIDDYAHHPTEIENTLLTVKKIKEAQGFKRIIILFQPHLYSRTRDHAYEFALSLKECDFIFLAPIFPAREKPLPEISSQSISDHWASMSFNQYQLVSLETMEEILLKFIQPQDIVISLGAGNLDQILKKIYVRF